MKEGYSKSKPALNTDFTPSSAEVDTGTDPHPGCACHAGRKKHRSTAEERDLINRLNRIEGQIRGIKKMLEADAYCPDVLTQVAAARCAMNSFAKVLGSGQGGDHRGTGRYRAEAVESIDRSE